MLDGQRIAAANAAAREELGTHLVGQDARVALRHPEAIRLLSKPAGRALVRGLTGARSIWQVSRVPIDERFSLIEMVNRTADEATAARFHATVLRESKRLQSLVEDLMSLSRIEAEKHEVPRDRIDLGQLVGSIGSEVAMSTGEGRLEVETVDAVVAGDRQQLDQLVRNLIDNAFKYGHAGAPVKVRITAADGETVLTVTDQGDGIHPDHLPYLTRRFYRTDPGRSRTAGGTGLGLAIVKHIVERHRGKLDITSALGVGTTVTVRIPLAGPAVEPADLPLS